MFRAHQVCSCEVKTAALCILKHCLHSTLLTAWWIFFPPHWVLVIRGEKHQHARAVTPGSVRPQTWTVWDVFLWRGCPQCFYQISLTVPNNLLWHYLLLELFQHTSYACFQSIDFSSPFVLLSRTFDTLRNHPSFYLFNHRGRVLFRSPEEEPSSVRNQQALPNPIRLRKLEHLHWDWSFHAAIVIEAR